MYFDASRVVEIPVGYLTTTLDALGGRLLDLRGRVGLGGAGSLVGLLLLLRSLGLGDGGLAGSGTNLGLGGTLSEDRGEVGTDNTTLGVSLSQWIQDKLQSYSPEL